MHNDRMKIRIRNVCVHNIHFVLLTYQIHAEIAWIWFWMRAGVMGDGWCQCTYELKKMREYKRYTIRVHHTTPHHSINRLSNKNIIYLRVCSMHGPLHHLAAFLLISHIQWPICTWIYRKINRGTVWRCRCCRIQLLIVVMLQSLYTALFCLPFSSLHTMCIWCLFHSHFVLNSTQYLNSRIHLYKASSHSTEPVFQFQSKSSVCAHFRCVCLFFYSFVWLKGNIISESVYEKVCESIRVHLRLFSDSQKKTAKTIFGTYHSSLRRM